MIDSLAAIGAQSTRAQFHAICQRLAAPLLTSARHAGLAIDMPVETAPGSTRDRRPFAPLEALGRLLCGIAPALERQRLEGGEVISLADVHHLVMISTDPHSPQRLNFSQGQQPLVDAAFLAQAILRAPTALWADLPPAVQQNVLRAFDETRAIQPHVNNWLLFSAMIEAFFARVGEKWDRLRIDYALRMHDQWYAGDGFYADGPHLRFDYYNGYVIQPMLRDILDVVAAENRHWQAIRKAFVPRMARYAVTLERLIGPDGSFPPIGRSLAYRCAAFQPLAQLALLNELPPELPPGQVRTALAAVIGRTLAAPGNYDAQGWLRIGLNGSQPGLAENYISTGSLYLCSVAFLPLGLPGDASFWTDPDLDWSQKRIWGMGEGLALDKALDS